MVTIEESLPQIDNSVSGSLDNLSTATPKSEDLAFNIINEDDNLKTQNAYNKSPQSRINSNNSETYKRKVSDSPYHKNCYMPADITDKPYYKKSISNLSRSTDSFISSLDAKLRDLQDDDVSDKKKKKKSRTPKSKNGLDNRPMFITTVKTGIFLEPPPDIAALLGLKGSPGSASTTSTSTDNVLMYSYSSQPRVLHNRFPKKNNLAKSNQKLNNDKQEQKNNIRNKRDISKSINNLQHSNHKKEDATPAPCTYGNIMYDRRVVRGPAMLQHPIPTIGSESVAARQEEARRRAVARRKAQTQRAKALKYRLSTPPPVAGRKHEDVQTELYLEELVDHPIEATVATQTDYFLDRPSTPPYIPLKTGVDQATQIYPGELFHFDTEVEPILDVLVGKTLEQSLIEVLEEEELAAIVKQKIEAQQAKDIEAAQAARLAESEKRMREELELRIAEREEALLCEAETQERVAALVLTRGYLENLLPSVLQDLRDQGFLQDDVQESVEGKFMEWLLDEVQTELEKIVQNREVISDVLKEVIETRKEVYLAMEKQTMRSNFYDDVVEEDEPCASPQPEQVEEEEEEKESKRKFIELPPLPLIKKIVVEPVPEPPQPPPTAPEQDSSKDSE